MYHSILTKSSSTLIKVILSKNEQERGYLLHVGSMDLGNVDGHLNNVDEPKMFTVLSPLAA